MCEHIKRAHLRHDDDGGGDDDDNSNKNSNDWK